MPVMSSDAVLHLTFQRDFVGYDDADTWVICSCLHAWLYDFVRGDYLGVDAWDAMVCECNRKGRGFILNEGE